MDSDQLKKLIPKDKFDFVPFPALMELNEKKVAPILPDLLFCVADMNWPIAAEMVKVLVRFPGSVVPLIKDILKPTATDEEWKYFIISGLVPELPRSSQESLRTDINRILVNPTNGEVSSGVLDAAEDYISSVEP